MDKWLRGIGIFLIALLIGIGGTVLFNYFVIQKNNEKTSPLPATGQVALSSSATPTGPKITYMGPDSIVTEQAVTVVRKYVLEKGKKPEKAIKEEAVDDYVDPDDEEDSSE